MGGGAGVTTWGVVEGVRVGAERVVLLSFPLIRAFMDFFQAEVGASLEVLVGGVGREGFTGSVADTATSTT